MQENEKIISVKGLHKHFGDIHAVNDVNISIAQGEIFGFLGPNGSGKTTTIRMLCGLLTPDEGQGHCLGYDILKESRKIKQQVGYMTQRFSYYEDLTVYENLNFIAQLYQLDNRKSRIHDVIEKMGFQKRAHQLAGTLSGGWKQRLALAGSLVHDPKLLLLDEPTAGVDPEARRQFWNHIHELSQSGITTLVSTHYMDEAERCTRLSYIMHGKLLIEGTLDEIIKQVDLTTWVITGDKIGQVASQIESIGIEQVIVFGNTLHLSSRDTDKLQQAIRLIQKNPNYQCEQKPSTIEDIFIHLAEHEQ